MYRLTQAAEADIEAILTQSFSQFGALQTERYFHSLRACLELWLKTLRWVPAPKRSGRVIGVFLTKAMSSSI